MRDCEALRQHLDLLADAQRPVYQRAGDDGAEAGHRERAIEREARASEVLAGARFLGEGPRPWT